MRSKKVKAPFLPGKSNARQISEAQMETDRLAAEAWAREHGVKKAPPDCADYSYDASRLFGRASQATPTFRG